MNSWKPVYMWLGVVVALSLGSLYFSTPTRHSDITELVALKAQPVPQNYNLTTAIRATVMIDFSNGDNCGSAILIGRERKEDGTWKYHALTCHHIIQHWLQFVMQQHPNDEEEAQSYKALRVTAQEDFHGEPIVFNTELASIECQFPYQDWAIISFDIPQKLQCAILATSKQFKDIQPFEPIYAMGNDDGRGLYAKQGIIAITHNVVPENALEEREVNSPWNKIPDLFFRPSINAWFGASGGAVYQKDGYVIGMLSALSITTKVGHYRVFASYSCVASKVHLIREILLTQNPAILTIED